jgi:hypothetical protein
LLPYFFALTLFPGDALAWGLETHLFFAQWLLAALPFADPGLRGAAARLPRLVLAGACLPDLALAGKALGLVAFRRAHEWSTLRRMTSAPRSDADRALAMRRRALLPRPGVSLRRLRGAGQVPAGGDRAGAHRPVHRLGELRPRRTCRRWRSR